MQKNLYPPLTLGDQQPPGDAFEVAHELVESFSRPSKSLAELIEKRRRLLVVEDYLVGINNDEEWYDEDGEDIEDDDQAAGEPWTRPWVYSRFKDIPKDKLEEFTSIINNADSLGEASGNIDDVCENNPSFSCYLGPKGKMTLLMDYINCLDDMVLKGDFQGAPDITTIKQLDRHLSPLYLQGFMLTLMESISDTGADTQWDVFIKLLRSPAALLLNETSLLQSALFNLGRAIGDDGAFIKRTINCEDVSKQLINIATLKEISIFFEGSRHWGYGALTNEILESIEGLVSRTDINPLVKAVATGAIADFEDAYGEIRESESFGGTSYDYYNMTADGSFRRRRIQEPNFYMQRSQPLSEINSVSREAISIITGPGGRAYGVWEPNNHSLEGPLPLTDYAKKLNIPGLEQLDVFQQFCESFFLHQVRDVIEEDLGISFHEISLKSQLIFVSYLSRQKNCGGYERLKGSLSNLDKSAKKIYLEAFLALEFGEDFGDPLLEVVEKAGEQQMPYINQALQSISASLGNVSKLQEGFLSDIDPGWAEDIRRGVSTRISEALFELSHRLESHKITAIKTSLEVLSSIQEWSEGTYKMLVESRPELVAQAGDTMLFHFHHPSEGLLPGAVECSPYGKDYANMSKEEKALKEGRGARFSVTYDEIESEAALSLVGAKRRKALNGRFDKSTYNKLNRMIDPDANQAEASFDMFSHHGSGRSRNAANGISDGRARRTGQKGAYTYDIINQEWGDRELFASLIDKITIALKKRANETHSREVGRVSLAS